MKTGSSYKLQYPVMFTTFVTLSLNNLIASVAASSSADALEAARFGPLPPTVFAPGGRLHGVERAARESYPSGDDESSCAAVALRCGAAAGGEFAIISGIGAISPFLHRDEDCAISAESKNDTRKTDSYIPLVMDYGEYPDNDAPLTPISVISPDIIVGVGGKGIDSAILLRRAAETALSMYKSDNGGVEWFMSHSLEGISDNSNHDPIGGAARVEVKTLVKILADAAQSSTQHLGGKSGRMLSSSLLAVGVENKLHGSNECTRIQLWRVDPTGQFWNLDGGAVGRAAISVEAELLKKVRTWLNTKKQQPTDAEESETTSCNKDVKEYLASLTLEEALTVATDCLINGIVSDMKRDTRNLHSNGLLDNNFLLEKGLRKRLKTAIIRTAPFGVAHANSFIELVRG